MVIEGYGGERRKLGHFHSGFLFRYFIFSHGGEEIMWGKNPLVSRQKHCMGTWDVRKI